MGWWWRGGPGGAFGVVLLLYSTCLILPVGSQKKSGPVGFRRRDTFCAMLGQEGYYNSDNIKGPYTIGGNLNRLKDQAHFNSIASFYEVQIEVGNGKLQLYEDWIMGEGGRDKNPGRHVTCGTGAYDYVWENIINAYTEFCPKDVTIRAYLVKQHGRVLKGWLHFEVEMTNEDPMEYILIQMRDENMNFVGEFVTEEDEQCRTPNSKSNLVPPTKYQVLPCSAVGLREAKASNSILMATADAMVHGEELKKRTGFLPPEEGKIGKGVHFNWRLNEYWCNRHLRFKLEAYVWTKQARKNWNDPKFRPTKSQRYCNDQNKHCRIKRTTTAYWIYPKWFGAADIKLPSGDLNCSVQAINFTTGRVNTDEKNSWIKSITSRESELKYSDDILAFITPYLRSYRTKGCQGNVTRSFGGRCEDVVTKNPFTQNLHGCSNPNSEKDNSLDFTSYTKYSTFLYDKRTEQCMQPCEEPNITNPDHLAEIKSYPRGNRSENSKNRKPKILINTLVNSRRSVRATTFWQTRKFHGSLCIFLILFLIPISNFFSRYYKETFMHSRGLGCAPWFWFHLFVCFAVPTLLWGSYSAMTQTINSFGRSTSSEAVFHRIFGRVFVTGFILMICLGGLRPVQTHLRLVCMALHSVVGFTLYIFGIILIVNSTYIPSSPSVADCDKDDGLPIGFSFTATMTLAWLVIDILFHVLLTILQFVTDRRYEIKRAGWGLPFVPILPAISPYSRADLVGTRFRKVVLLLYVIIAATITFVTIAELFRKDLITNCTLGNMTCDLTQTSPNKASSPFGCDAFALKYYSNVYNKYDLKNAPGAQVN